MYDDDATRSKKGKTRSESRHVVKCTWRIGEGGMCKVLFQNSIMRFVKCLTSIVAFLMHIFDEVEYADVVQKLKCIVVINLNEKNMAYKEEEGST